MKLTKTKFEKPITGTGIVKVGEKSFTILLNFKDSKGEQEEKYTFKLADLPENLPDGWELKSGKSYFASISTDGSKLLGIRPAKGLFRVRCIDLSETKDGEYLVVERSGDYGPYSQFVPLLTVQTGPNKGIDYPIYLPYASGDTRRFAPGDDGLMEVRGNPEKSRPIAQLFEFVTYTGIADLDLEYPVDGDDPDDDPQSVLEVIHKAIRKQKQDFNILVENGYVKSMSELDDDGETDTVPDDEKEAEEKEEEEENKKPAPAKKKPKWDDD